jgi:predicted DCC family thiol-disulfide oxidoreductase YuxK
MTSRPDLLFYDGRCGLCHRLVRFAVTRDRDGTRFRFAPLEGETFLAQYDSARRAALPDSIVLHTADGRTMLRSEAAFAIAERLGGPWRVAARLAGLLPRWLTDLGYDAVARIRGLLFARPEGSCPLLPPEVRGRFLP